MAERSEAFAWKLFPGLRRVCDTCGRDLRVRDVREHRTNYPGGRTVFYCKDCVDGRHRPETDTAET
jgi:hypothetical protein